MVYIVMDLEWNSVYGPKIRGYLNEIIEIGAVMLDANFREISSFSVLVRSVVGTRLQSHVKELTNITRADLENGLPFRQAIAQFKAWIGTREHVILTWGDGDIRVLLANTRYFSGVKTLNYLQRYVDLQHYFQHRMQTPRAQQVGLSAAGEMIGIDTAAFAFHRALDDSRFAAECLRKIYSCSDFHAFCQECTPDFYGQLEFKPRIISDIRSP